MDATVSRIAEATIRADEPLDPVEIVHLRPYLESFLDTERLNQELAQLDNWVPANSDRVFVWNELDRPLESNMLIAAIWAARRWEEAWEIDRTFRPPPAIQRLVQIAVSMAIAESHASDAFTDDARRHIKHRLHSAQGVWSMIHEIQAFGTFACKGIQCTPQFLINSSRNEMTLEWNGQSIPAQCKAKLPGAGRHIRRDLFTRLAASIARDAKASGRRRFFHIEAVDGLQTNDLDYIRSAAANASDSTVMPIVVTPSRARSFIITSRPAGGRISRAIAESSFAREGYYATLTVGASVRGPTDQQLDVFVGINAEPDGPPWRTVARSIDEAADQLSNGPPGFALVHTFDPQAPWPPNGDMPNWLGILLTAKLAQYDSLLGINVSTEPAFGTPTFNGRAETRWLVKERLLPDGIPLGKATIDASSTSE